MIVRNALQVKEWGTEERDLEVDFPFYRNKSYSIKILAAPSGFKVVLCLNYIVTLYAFMQNRMNMYSV